MVILLKTYIALNIFPFVIKNYINQICKLIDCITTSPDSFVTYYNSKLPVITKTSIFTFHKEWVSQFFVFRYDKKAYFLVTRDQNVIIKGDELSPYLILKLYHFVSSKYWLYEFKKWFLQEANSKYFITNKGNVYLKNKVIKNFISNVKLTNIDKERYWRKLLPYFRSIFEEVS